MKRVLMALVVGLIVSVAVHAEVDPNIWVQYMPIDRDLIDIYYVAGGTETAASFDFTGSSLSLHVEGGFYPGTVGWTASATYFDTIDEVISWIEAEDQSDRTAFEGEWVLTKTDATYGSQATTCFQISASSATGCLEVANVKTIEVAYSSWSYITYTKPAISWKTMPVQYFIGNATFTGSAVIQLFDTDGTVLGPSMTMTSGVDKVCPQTSRGNFIAIPAGNKGIEVRITGSGLTDGYITVSGTLR